MSMHAAAAVVAWTAAVLYWLHAGRSLARVSLWESVVRVGLGLMLVSVAAAFIDLAAARAPFEWRHWLVLTGTSVVVGGYAIRYWPTH